MSLENPEQFDLSTEKSAVTPGPERMTDPDILQMYSVPGYPPVTKREMERYLRARRYYQDEVIRSADLSPLAVMAAFDDGQLNRNQLAEKINGMLQGNNPCIQVEAVSMIRVAPASERSKLIKIALQNPTPEVRVQATEEINRVPSDERRLLKQELFETVHAMLLSLDQEMQAAAARMIIHTPRKKWNELIGAALNSNHPSVLFPTCELRVYLGASEKAGLDNKIVQIVTNMLLSNDPETQVRAAEMIVAVPDNELFRLIETALQKCVPEAQVRAINSTWRLLPHQLTEVIAIALRSIHAQVRFEAVKKVAYSLESTHFRFVEEASREIKNMLQSSNPEERITAAFTALYMPEVNFPGLNRTIAETLRDMLLSDNPNMQVSATASFFEMHDADMDLTELAPIVRSMLLSRDPKALVAATRMIGWVPHDIQASLVDFIADHYPHLINILIVSPLYEEYADLKQRPMARVQFSKSGSQSILLGGSLTGSVIIRRIDASAFMAWQKLYENHALWQANGFDYVPIEPIISFYPTGGEVDVASGVLDLNLERYMNEEWGEFKYELGLVKRRILSVLARIDFRHGHPHNGNFCLRFFRHPNGMVDLNRQPRLYLIDFDQAISQQDSTA
ncbi:hypothetical protein KGQ71_01415 [Patescibacteria group bacterium]|nr:hypothetical protein [Patescibacteria group bacterium]